MLIVDRPTPNTVAVMFGVFKRFASGFRRIDQYCPLCGSEDMRWLPHTQDKLCNRCGVKVPTYPLTFIDTDMPDVPDSAELHAEADMEEAETADLEDDAEEDEPWWQDPVA